MGGLPKSYIKRYGISKKAWSEYRKANKGRTTKRKVVGVKKVTRRRRYTRKRKRRHSPKIPLEVVIAGLSIPFMPAESGWSSPLKYAMDKDFEGLGASLASGFLGVEGGRTPTGVNLIGLLNPFDFNTGRYLKMLVIGGIASKIRKSVVKISFKRVPFIGKYIS